MSLVSLTFSVAGDVQLDRALSLASKNIKNIFGIAGPDIRDDFLQNEQEQFRTEGGHGSGGWQDLSPAYAAEKAKHYPGAPILVRTGALRSSLTRESDQNFIYRAQPLTLTLGTRVPYGVYHQKGGPDLPVRKPIELIEAQKRRWMKLMQEAIWKSGQGYERVIL